jgi:hypothetical protein
VPVTIPTDAMAGKAQIRDQLGFPLGVVRLVVRP